jgi:hypothetical protein
MKTESYIFTFKSKKPVLLNPVTDDQQRIINERVDMACLSRMDLHPTDPRSLPYVREALWLWK